MSKGVKVSRIQGFKEMFKNYKELKVWEKSYQLCLEVYRITKGFPKIEIFGLISQMRRAALSIPSNIAEGYGRKTIAEYLRFLYIAYGSVCELETQIMLSGDLGYLEGSQLLKLQNEVREVERMLQALIKSLKNKPLSP
jgi:four helix bundle protein